MKRETDMAGILEDFIRQHGAPNALFSDNSKAQIGRDVQEILRMCAIRDFQWEPHHQHQNPEERRIQEVKKLSNHLLDCTGSPAHLWLLCVDYVVYLLNRLSTESLEWKAPLEVATGQQPDISALIAFRWYEPVYYKNYSPAFPSNSNECLGNIVGFAEQKGDSLTFLILDSLTSKVIARSELRSALTKSGPNLRAENPSNFPSDVGESPAAKPILSSTDYAGLDIDPSNLKLPKFSPDELIGKTFARTLDDGKTCRAKIVRKIIDQDAENHKNLKFLATLGEGEFDEIIAYHSLCDIVEEHEEATLSPDDTIWTFTSIEGHQGPLKHGHPDHKGSSYNVLVVWEDGSKTYEPLDKMIKDDSITLAIYARKNNLLGVPGWKRLKNIASKVAKEHETITNNLFILKGMRTKEPYSNLEFKSQEMPKKLTSLTREMGTPTGKML
jgi:hypothetical protein